MRILVDYRPALRQCTGVGEYTHELIRAFARRGTDEVTVFTSSWKDRASPDLSAILGCRVMDWRIPGAVLNLLWHRTGWPAVELLAGPADVVHAAHPLLIPTSQAAQVVTIHDLFFITDPDSTRAEIRRDYVRLAPSHARQAHAVITSSRYGRDQVVDRLGVDPARIHIVSPGAPTWRGLGGRPNVPQDGYVLFVGTLEPRKNIGTLLDAWARVTTQLARPARLVLAGGATPFASQWLARVRDPVFRGTVEHRGYVKAEDREALYAGARVLVLPSLDEGFGLPVLEAMSAGVPVVASRRGAIPEVTAGAAALVEPTDVEGLAAALLRTLRDDSYTSDLAERGVERARAFTWEAAGEALAATYADAARRRRSER